jgi:hypothetical protein
MIIVFLQILLIKQVLTDKNVEMKAINRQIKLISEIDKALIKN